jgi:hypothetical protein
LTGTAGTPENVIVAAPGSLVPKGAGVGEAWTMRGDTIDGFVTQYREEQDRLRQELLSYEPRGVMRLWAGRAIDNARDVTAERIADLERQIARVGAMIEFARAVQKML